MQGKKIFFSGKFEDLGMDEWLAKISIDRRSQSRCDAYKGRKASAFLFFCLFL
jgi:hypothetical protein